MCVCVCVSKHLGIPALLQRLPINVLNDNWNEVGKHFCTKVNEKALVEENQKRSIK